LSVIISILAVLIWFFVDGYLAVRIKEITNSDKKLRLKALLVGTNVLADVSAIFVYLTLI